MLQDGAARDVDNKGIAFAEDGEFFFREEVLSLWGQGDGDEEDVDVLFEEVVEGGFVQAAVPRAGDLAFRIPGSRNDVTCVVFTPRGRAGRRSIRDDVQP